MPRGSLKYNSLLLIPRGSLEYNSLLLMPRGILEYNSVFLIPRGSLEYNLLLLIARCSLEYNSLFLIPRCSLEYNSVFLIPRGSREYNSLFLIPRGSLEYNSLLIYSFTLIPRLEEAERIIRFFLYLEVAENNSLLLIPRSMLRKVIRYRYYRTILSVELFQSANICLSGRPFANLKVFSWITQNINNQHYIVITGKLEAILQGIQNYKF